MSTEYFKRNEQLIADYKNRMKKLQLRIDAALKLCNKQKELIVHDLENKTSYVVNRTIGEDGSAKERIIRYNINGKNYTYSKYIEAEYGISTTVANYRCNSPKDKWKDWISLDWRQYFS